MKPEAALAHLAAYREGKVTDPRLSKALRCVEEGDLARREQLAGQVAFDRNAMEMLGAIQSPEDLRRRLANAQAAQAKAALRPRHHLTAVISIGFGVAMIIAVLIFFHLQSLANFPGRESLLRIAGMARTMTGAELEPVANAAGELGDWFFMRGFEGYRLPTELRSAPAVGSRLFKLDGHPVAQIAVDTHQSLVYVLKGEDFGVILPSSDWTIFQAQDWVAAARPFDSSVVMVTFRGSEAEMKDFLSTLKK